MRMYENVCDWIALSAISCLWNQGGLDSEVVDFLLLSEDWKKLAACLAWTRLAPNPHIVEISQSLETLETPDLRHCTMHLHALLISFVQGLQCRIVLQGYAFGRSHPGIPLSVWPASPSTSPKVSNAKISLYDFLCLCSHPNCHAQHTCHQFLWSLMWIKCRREKQVDAALAMTASHAISLSADLHLPCSGTTFDVFWE